MAKIIAPKLNKGWLDDVPGDKVFHCHDGRELRNLDDLSVALKDISEEAFKHHVNSEKNDFSYWINDVIGDVTLARQLTKTATPISASKKVDVRLSTLRKVS